MSKFKISILKAFKDKLIEAEMESMVIKGNNLVSLMKAVGDLQKNFIARFQLQLIYFLKAVKWCILALSIVPVLSVESTDIISCPLRARCRFCCFCTRAWDY